MRRVIDSLRRPFTKRERGQMLVIFAAIFFVTLGLGAFAVDQGMWLSKRRSAQKDADTSARGGIYALLSNPSSAGARETAAETAGREVADQNGVPNNANTTFAYDDRRCETAVFGPWDVPSLHVVINDPTGSLFGRVLGIDGMQDLGAQATACIGEPDLFEGIDPFYIAPNAAGPDLKCFNADGTPKLGTICPIVVPSGYTDQGSRGNLSLQDDPYAAGVDLGCDPWAKSSCETECTEGGGSNVDQQVVQSSPAICRDGDGVYTKQGTFLNNMKALRCRILGYDDVRNDCPNGTRSTSAAPGEGYCDADFSDGGADIPPFYTELDPPFDAGDVIGSPGGVDDFTEAFSAPGGGPPTSLAGTEWLVANLCNNGKESPRIITIIIGKAPPVNGVMEVSKFATFFVLGCRDLEGGTSDTFIGPIDPFCSNVNGNRTAMVGIFVKSLLAAGGGPLGERCDDPEAIGCSILLVQ